MTATVLYLLGSLIEAGWHDAVDAATLGAAAIVVLVVGSALPHGSGR
jgi:hypothetical protein